MSFDRRVCGVYVCVCVCLCMCTPVRVRNVGVWHVCMHLHVFQSNSILFIFLIPFAYKNMYYTIICMCIIVHMHGLCNDFVMFAIRPDNPKASHCITSSVGSGNLSELVAGVFWCTEWQHGRVFYSSTC